MNAAVWFGAAVFYVIGAGPAIHSDDMRQLLTPKNFPFYSGAIEHLVASRWIHLQTACALVAVLHVVAEWLYLGRIPPRLWRGWLLGLCAVTLVCGYIIEPRAHHLHRLQFSTNAAHREEARSAPVWHGAFRWTGLLLAAGVAAYLWQVSNPPDKMKFVGTGHFLG